MKSEEKWAFREDIRLIAEPEILIAVKAAASIVVAAKKAAETAAGKKRR